MNQGFFKNYNEESDEGYSLEVDVHYLEKLHELHNYLSLLPRRMKNENFQKLVTNLHDKTEYLIYIRNLKQALNNELVLKKVHRVIKFNQDAWLKTYFDMNTEIRTKAKNYLKKFFLSWWIMQFLENPWKMWENIEILNLLQQKEEETVCVRTKLSFYKVFHIKFIGNRNEKKKKKKNEMLTNKAVYLGLSILELSKRLMYKFWYDHVKPK